ncbi:MAG: hypothetical protein ACTSW1_10750 [Candidatus Hodarchaeales archaeon]
MDDRLNKDHEYMLSLSNKKVEQHIAYLLGVVGALFTFISIPEQYMPIILSYKLHILFGFLLLSFTIHNGGKLVYWSVINHFILTHAPADIIIKEEEDQIYWSNNKWKFLNAAKLDILQRTPYNTIKRAPFEKFKLWIAKQFSSIQIFLFCIGASILIWIVSLVF